MCSSGTKINHWWDTFISPLHFNDQKCNGQSETAIFLPLIHHKNLCVFVLFLAASICSPIRYTLVHALIFSALFPLQVFDYDFGFQDDFMGSAQVHLESLEHQRSSPPLLSRAVCARINTVLSFLYYIEGWRYTAIVWSVMIIHIWLSQIIWRQIHVLFCFIYAIPIRLWVLTVSVLKNNYYFTLFINLHHI